MFVCNFLLEVMCPPLEAYPHLHLSTSDTFYGIAVVATCDVGFMFDNGLSVCTLTCTGTGEWDIIIPRCKSKNK